MLTLGDRHLRSIPAEYEAPYRLANLRPASYASLNPHGGGLINEYEPAA